MAIRIASLKKFVLIPVVLALGACSVTDERPVEPEVSAITVDMLLRASPLQAYGGAHDTADTDVLALSDEMVEFLERSVDDGMGEETRLRQLLRSIMFDDRFELVYDDQTRTAAETFRDQRGNCLSFTNMFVAMARYLDLDARFQEVKVPPDWSLAGHALMLSEHVNVYLNMSQFTDRVVDFNTEVVHFFVHDLKPNYERQVISDERARAHYFNNVGVEHMLLGGDNASALVNFRHSLEADPTFSPAWISLGILYRREGYLNYAKASFLQALNAQPYNLVAMSNLASVYELSGETEQAEFYKAEVKAHRLQNPYYRFELAREAFVNGDYEEAIDHLHAAIRRQEHESEFYALLSLCYMMNGNGASAERWMRKAEEAASEAGEKQKYRRKLEIMEQRASRS